ncbi:Gfo/Idh/MocA family protein [Haloferula sp. A504]|uniref:Gfo/Idh/MocA family protein n=1 Tax=Haloferula sp. A504 TaxID=3373601 RepID=UPI0031CB538E|nr:Gfo/Idh/MocA family oxidoreductase [Verrucomicrobiaceae bacterium E54]
MKTHISTSRRRFLGGILSAGVTPMIVPSRLLASDTAPSNQICLGHIGVGGRGTALLRNFVSAKRARSVAVCDPYAERRERAAGMIKEAQGEAPKLYNDFRELLADDSIDAVVLATPDHWHVPIGLEAASAGKDIYFEKPLGYTLEQNRAMEAAIRKHDVIFQYGTQQRSQEITKRGIELVLNGYIGELKEVHVWAPAGQGGGSTEEIPVPEGLDYDLYLGPAPLKPCTKDRITSKGSWFCRDYALGFIAGWGAHPLDFAVWGLDYDQQGPVKFKGGGKFPPKTDLFNACTNWDVEIDFGGKVAMRFVSSDLKQKLAGGYLDKIPGDGTTFIGSEGWVSLSRGSAQASNPEWLRMRQCEGDRRVHYRPNYYHGFIDTVRERAPSVGPIGEAVRSDALSHLSIMAIEAGEEVVWDPKGYRIVSPESLNGKMSTEIRGDWRQS